MRETTIQLRTSVDEKGRWQKAAGEGVPLSYWIRKVLNEAAGYAEPVAEEAFQASGRVSFDATTARLEQPDSRPAVVTGTLGATQSAGKTERPASGPIRPPVPGVVPASELPPGRRQVTYDRRAGFDQTRR